VSTTSPSARNAPPARDRAAGVTFHAILWAAALGTDGPHFWVTIIEGVIHVLQVLFFIGR
jgi:hypothetical protein